MVLDVPPRARIWLGDPTRPLFITEGVRKADAAVSRDLCCIALLGVWNWRGRNADGGTTALADWESIALKGRTAYVVFDSDLMTKAPVYVALARLKAFLERRGSEVRIIYLPPAAGGAKQGLDDYLAGGSTIQDLLALATDELRVPLGGEATPQPPSYRATPEGLVWDRPTRKGSEADPADELPCQDRPRGHPRRRRELVASLPGQGAPRDAREARQPHRRRPPQPTVGAGRIWGCRARLLQSP
jgi:hypothetical protein